MTSVNHNFFTEVRAFASNHKVLCCTTFGVALALYSLGNLAGRVVSWISESMGTTKKVDSVAREQLQDAAIIPPTAPVALTLNASKLLTAFNSSQEGWVMVPPKDQIKTEQPFAIGSGAIGYDGNGRWKLHVSINPLQMEAAIPIILDVLHGSNAPRLGFKVQTKANLDSVHQIGKDFTLPEFVLNRVLF